VCPDQALPSIFLTDDAYHRPPRAVATPRALRASAISLSVVAPAFLISRMIGSTSAAWLSAAAPMVSKATSRLGELRSPDLHTARYCQCRLRAGADHRPLLFRKRHEQVTDERVTVRPKLGDQERRRMDHSEVVVTRTLGEWNNLLIVSDI